MIDLPKKWRKLILWSKKSLVVLLNLNLTLAIILFAVYGYIQCLETILKVYY